MGEVAGDAIKAMNQSVAPKPRTFGAYTAERLFRDVVEEFLATACVEPALSRRITSLFTRLVARRYVETRQAPSADQLNQIRAHVRSYIEGHEAWCAETYENFFFVDLVPENAERFPITLEECRGVATPSVGPICSRAAFTALSVRRRRQRLSVRSRRIKFLS